MIWIRRLVVSVFSLILLVALIGAVETASINTAFSNPTNTEQWLSQSQLYQHFVSAGLAQVAQQNTGSGTSLLTSDNSQAVKQALEQAFPAQLINQSVHTFLNANYAWLKGNTAKPDFSIDLAPAKEQFIKQATQTVFARLQQLPVCNLSHLNQLQTTDILDIDCRPPGIGTTAETLKIQQEVTSNTGFLSNPVITADNLNPQQGSSQPPYYQRFRQLPRAYQAAQKLPYALAALALISALIILFAAPTKRLAWRHIAKVLITAGVILALGKLVFDTIYNRGQASLFNNASNGDIQRALTDFAHRAIDYVAQLNMIGGGAYLTLAVIIIIVLFLTRRRRPRQPRTGQATSVPIETTSQDAAGSTEQGTSVASPKPTAPLLPSNRSPSLNRKNIIQ